MTLQPPDPSALPISETGFYEKRDDRTNLVTNSDHYQDAPILLAIEQDKATSVSGQVMALTSAVLASRFNRNVDLAYPDIPLESLVSHPLLPERLRTRAVTEMELGDPFGEFTGVDREEIADSDTDYSCALTIGNPSVQAEKIIRIDSCGWAARITRNEQIRGFNETSPNPIGPAAAACFGIAELFKSLIGCPPEQQPGNFTFDALTLRVEPGELHTTAPAFPDNIELGTVELVGVGSIGSSLLYMLPMLPIEGTFTLTDPDVVEYSNLNRSPIFNVKDAAEERNKTLAGERFICDSVDVRTFSERYGASRAQDDVVPDIVLPEVDSDQARADIQYSRPPLMLETTTNESSVNVARHIPIVDACLLCHFPPGESSYTPACATLDNGSIPDPDEEEEGPDAALPFVSTLAGILLAGELVKTNIEEYPFSPSFVEIETFTNFSTRMPRYDKQHNDECPFCSYCDDTQYRRLIQNTKFEDLIDLIDRD